MELRQLEYFVAVAEEANFTRAAERVHISQSGVSAQIRQLERELGATLIDRSGRKATLTAAGAAVLPHARAVLAAATAVRRAVDEVTGLVRGRLEVGMVTGCTVTPLFEALAAFRGAHPGVELALLEDNSELLLERLRAGELDLGLVGLAGAPPPDLEAMTIVSERLIAVAAPRHPLAARTRTTLGEVATYPIVCMPEGTGLRAVFDQACRARGLGPEIALEASAPPAIADLASRGLGVGILSESMQFGPRVSAAIIDDIELPAVLALVWRAGSNHALSELLLYCRQAFAPQAAAA
jgi:DNA-binding transcriptional LysR family regulator